MTIIRVVDFETTGMEPPAVIIEVGYCDYTTETKTIDNPISWLCGADEIPPDNRAVHHISPEMVADLEPWTPDQMTADVAAWAAHNSDFESRWFQPAQPMICTYKAALRMWPHAPSHSNGALRYWLQDQGLLSLDHDTAMPPHRAGPDAYVTAHILKALFEAGVVGKDLIAWTKEPRLLPTCPLGKFRGKPWPEVEDGFLGWMLRQPTMEDDLKWNAEREISRRSGLTP